MTVSPRDGIHSAALDELSLTHISQQGGQRSRGVESRWTSSETGSTLVKALTRWLKTSNCLFLLLSRRYDMLWREDLRKRSARQPVSASADLPAGRERRSAAGPQRHQAPNRSP